MQIGMEIKMKKRTTRTEDEPYNGTTENLADSTHTLVLHSKTADPSFRQASGSEFLALHLVNARFASTHSEPNNKSSTEYVKGGWGW